jgi:hypothetical protein
MSAFTPEGLPFIPTEFAAPQPLQIAPDIRYQLFERMEQEVEQNPRLSQDQASWLLRLAFSDPIQALQLKHRFERPGGFNGPNAL